MLAQPSAHDIVRTIEGAGGRLRVDDDGQLKVAAPPSLLDKLRPAIKAHKAELVALVKGAPDAWGEAEWRHYFHERAAIREHDGRAPRAEAERLAYGEALHEWHRRHGARPDRSRCAGCDQLVSGADVLDFGTDGRVHSAGDCLERYGRRWRGAAEAALRRFGIVPPASWEADR